MFNEIHTIQSSIAKRRGLSPFPHCSCAKWRKNLPGLPSQELNSGLYFTKIFLIEIVSLLHLTKKTLKTECVFKNLTTYQSTSDLLQNSRQSLKFKKKLVSRLCHVPVSHKCDCTVQCAKRLHCKKRLTIFPSSAGMSLTKLSLAGNN